MNLRELEYISAVARLRHFGKAAKACHVSQPTLSSQILKLEAELGVTIFERIRGAVRVTEHGQAILEAAERATHAAADIRALAKGFQDPFSGELTLGVIPTIGPFLLPIFSGHLLRQYPKLKLTYIEDTTDRLNELLLSGEMDAAILATLPLDKSLTQMPLYDEKFHVALPNDHKLCAQKTGQPQGLTECTFTPAYRRSLLARPSLVCLFGIGAQPSHSRNKPRHFARPSGGWSRRDSHPNTFYPRGLHL